VMVTGRSTWTLGRGALSLGLAALCAIACSSNGTAQPLVADGGGPTPCLILGGCPVAVCDCADFSRTFNELTNSPDNTCKAFAVVCDPYCKKSASTVVATRCAIRSEFEVPPMAGGRFPGERCNPLPGNGGCVFPEVLPRCADGRMLPGTTFETIECPSSTKVCPSEAELVAKYCFRKDAG
jgi:hypothetical protein